MSHPFEVGKTYRNRSGEYVVEAIEGDRMTIRYVGGRTLETSVSIQTRIWENIQFEEQMHREEERSRLAKEARLAARKRTSRAKAAKAKPTFDGFQEDDFESRKRGLAWSSRDPLGKVLAYNLSQRTSAEFLHWIVPRQPRIHVGRKDHYDRDAQDANAAFFVHVTELGVACGFRVGKPDGKEKDESPWASLLAALDNDEKLRRSLRAAMKAHDLSLDVYAMGVSYAQVGRISLQPRGFLWQHETEEQEMTRKMNWGQLVEYLNTVAPGARVGLHLRQQIPPAAALEAGDSIAGSIVDLLESLLPVYDASIDV